MTGDLHPISSHPRRAYTRLIQPTQKAARLISDVMYHGDMQMLGKIINKARTKYAVHRLNKMPTIQYGSKAIDTYWTGNHEIIKDFSVEFIEERGEYLMGEVIKIATSSDPKMVNREKLTNHVISYAQLQVLVIPPPPAEDQTGLRGQPGITGELKSRLLDLAQKDKTLREFMHGYDTPRTWDDVWNPVLLEYRWRNACINVFNQVRLAFDDVNFEKEKDWFKPFVAAMCASQEHHYRMSIGMPPSLPYSEDEMGATMYAVAMSTFSYRVMEGIRYPDIEWKKHMQEFEHGDGVSLT